MPKKVLVVDDSKTTRDMVGFTLKRAGYDVITAKDGSEAIAATGNGPVDFVITDLNMPVRDGVELIRDLRANPIYRTTPILMLTTENASKKTEAGRLAGATNSLTKPFHPSELVAIVAEMLRS